MIIDSALRNQLEKAAINKGSAFLTGSPTTLFDTASSLTNSAGTMVGAGAGAVTGAMANGAQAIQLAQQLPIQLVKDVTTYSVQKLGSAMGHIMQLPDMGVIMSKAQEIMGQYVRPMSEIMQELGMSAEDFAKQQEEKANKGKLEATQKKITETLDKVKEQVGTATDFVQTQCANIVSYAAEGPAFLEDKFTWVENQSKQFIDKQYDKAIAVTDKYKEAAIDAIADGAARQLANVVNNAQTRVAKTTLDKIQNVKQKAITKAKALVGQALLKLYSLIGG